MVPASENRRLSPPGPLNRLLILLVLTAMLGTTRMATAGDREDFHQAITTAIEARQKAAAAGGEWRDTEATITEAQQAARRGDYRQAISLADWAAEQGRLGYLQATAQRKADFPASFRK